MIGTIVWCQIMIGWAEPVMMKGRIELNDAKICYGSVCERALVIKFKNGDYGVRTLDECFKKKPKKQEIK